MKIEELSQSYIRQYKEQLPWDDISQFYHLNDNFLRQFHKFINWTRLMQWRLGLSHQDRQRYIKEYDLVFKQNLTWWGIWETHWKEKDSYDY